MKNLVLIMMSFFLLFSCKKSDLVAPESSTGIAGVTVKFSSSDFTDIDTRAVYESEIANVTILQFKDSKLIHRETLENINFNNMISLTTLAAVPATIMEKDAEGNNTGLLDEGAGGGNQVHFTCFIANNTSANQTKLDALSAVSTGIGATTFAQFRDVLKFDAQAYTAPPTDGTPDLAQDQIPMIGYYYGGVIEGATNQMNVSLTRMLAKINFTVNTANFTVTLPSNKVEKPSVIVNSITLVNVPKEITPYACQTRPVLPASVTENGVWQNGVMTPFPTYNAGKFDLVAPNLSKTPTATFIGYMPENARGSFAGVANNKEKNPEATSVGDKFGNVRTGFTYLSVDLDFTDSRGVIKNATYKIYIGANNHGDMNILRNTSYNVTTYIYGADELETDTRITTTNIFNPTDENLDFSAVDLQPTANSYIINPTTISGLVKGKYTISMVQALEGWKFIKAANNNDATNLLFAQFENLMIEGTDWEIVTHWRTWDGANKNITGAKATTEQITYKVTAENPTGTETPTKEANYFAVLDFTEVSALNLSNIGQNAVIALRKKTAPFTIYWSWHLWFTDYAPAATPVATTGGQIHQYLGNAFALTTGAYYGKYIMDRDLGAPKTGVTGAIVPPITNADAAKYYGMLYQWGRKDPFMGSQGAYAIAAIYGSDGKITNAGGNKISELAKATVLTTSLVDAVNNPSTYYFHANEWTTPNDNLWGQSGVKAPFDPCPAGWRVPIGMSIASENPWAGFGDSNPGSVTAGTTGYLKWRLPMTGQAGTAGGVYEQQTPGAAEGVKTTAWYPSAGYRHRLAGNLVNWGSTSTLWCSERYTGGGGGMWNSNEAIYPGGGTMASQGPSVRCTQEPNY